VTNDDFPRALRQIARQALYDAASGPLVTGVVLWVVYALLVLCSRAWGDLMVP
jgi:hypothetical protein